MDPANETADLKNYFQSVKSADVLDDYTIQFKCSKPYFKHLDMIGGMPIYPEHIYSKGDFNKSPYNRKPVGSGPYVFDSWDTNQQITFVRNPNYWRKTDGGYVDKMVYKIITDDNPAFDVLARGELDYMSMTPDQWVNRANAPDFEAKFNKVTYWATSGYVGGYTYIAWNMRRPMFKDKRVRQAMTMLLDRKQILDTIFYGLGKIQTGPAAWNSPEYDDTIKPWPFDPARAKKQLADAGWVDTDKDGIRDKDGVPFKFEYLIPTGSREYEQLATVYKEQLRKAGIQMNIRMLEWAAFIDNLVNRSFDACTLAWAIPVDQDPYQIWHSSQAKKGSNYPGYKNPKVDKLLEDARTVFDRDKRDAMYKKLHAILHEDQPYTFLIARERLVAIDKRIHGVKVYKQGLYPIEWWIPKASQRYK